MSPYTCFLFQSTIIKKSCLFFRRVPFLISWLCPVYLLYRLLFKLLNSYILSAMSDLECTLLSIKHTLCMYYLISFVTKMHSETYISWYGSCSPIHRPVLNQLNKCVCVCVCTHNFCGGNDDSKNIHTLQLKVIQTFSAINKCKCCRQIFRNTNIQHRDSGFRIRYILKVMCYVKKYKDSKHTNS